MRNGVYSYQKGVQILEKILRNRKATREKKLLALMGLVSMARTREIRFT